ncbi:MAG: insecticidal toxin complex protein [Saprospiraceae bacterium]|nr:insecticidal toxin complex protein [Saprospiraceae bacterium]
MEKANENQPSAGKFSFSSTSNTPSPDKGSDSIALQIPQISLPKGGGAIKGIDEKFEVNAANGTASLSLPLPFSAGRGGFMPAIALGYNSGVGNGVFGLGWDLGYPSIQRKTDKRLPQYRDREESDTFMFSGVEDLVPALLENGQNEEFTSDAYHIRRYCPRIEGSFSRIEKITHRKYGVWWKVTTRDNVVTFLGKSPEYRIADPANPKRIFQWLPELSFDDKGNCVLYEFKAEDGFGYGQALHDKNRFTPEGGLRFTNRYLKRVFYTPRRPFLPDFEQTENIYCTPNPDPADFLMELLFDYGEHGDIPDGASGHATVSYSEQNPWPTRSDAFSSYRAGFEIRTARLCRRVLMYHHFTELGHEPCLVRSLDLQYRDWSLLAGPEQGKKLEVTYLVAATQRSYVRENAGQYRFRGLPPVEFGYQELQWNTRVESVAPEDVANAPAGLSSGYQWVDLYNEGIAGILTEQGEGWFYKENLGNGRFTPAKPVIPKPSFLGVSTGVLQLQDLEADGHKQVVVNSPGLDGYFELTEDNGWEPFRAFTQIPNVDLRDPNTRLLDLNGDGQPEIVITEDRAFTWYPAAGVKGYDAPELAPKTFDEEQGPAIVFADSTQSIFLADISGDGLTDIVRIRNGEVCYWPNLGYGRFGRKVTMNGSPWFDASELFNPAYLQLADISGTGATDLLYLGKNRFRAWLNLSGNAWSAPCDIDPFPATAQPNAVTVTDLLGTGTACIVWSSPLPSNAQAPLRYIDLMGGQKPHVLNFYKNNLGKETRWTYKSSTFFYLADKAAGKPWITKLPFPVQVVSQVTVTDRWRQSTFSNTYTYHHGYYDHPEREFRGFGRVEQTDVEDFGAFAHGNAASPYITNDLTLYQPPVRTITWYHTGAFLSRERILNQFAEEYFQPSAGDFQENELPEPDLQAQNLSADEWREALRACKGMPLRTEIYELEVDDEQKVTDRRVKLFSTAFHNCHIQRLQPRENNPYSVFLVTESEAITYHYELDLTPPPPGGGWGEVDPRIAHTLNLRFDELGNVLESVAIGYPRRPGVLIDDLLLTNETRELIRSVQEEELHIAYTENSFTNDVMGDAAYRLRMPCEVRTYELTGLTPASGFYFSLDELREARIAENVDEIPYHFLPNGNTPQKRLVERVRILYFDENLHDPLHFGELNRLGLPYETYKIALTQDLLAAVLGNKLPALQENGETYNDMLARVCMEGGYHQFPDEPGRWWIRSGIAGFAEDAAEHFYLPERYTDPFGNETTLHFDGYDLYLDSSTDPLKNTVRVLRFDFRVLAPLEMEDINGNLSEVVFDILGMPAAVAVKGKGTEGDNLDDVLVELDEQALVNFFTGDYDEDVARGFLGHATARHLYYLGGETYSACACGIVREQHVAEGVYNSPILVAFDYSDGMGTILVKKAQAEPETPNGPLRWIASGKTVLNNKGKPVKQYEPYFSLAGHRFEEPQEVGVTPILYYDAAGRQVRTELPDGTFSRVEFSPWFTRTYDANDTVLESQWFAGRGGDPNWNELGEAPADPDRRAAFLAKIHANTPAETHLDSLGREVIAIAHNRFRWKDGNDFRLSDEKYVTYTKLDAEGKPLWIRDARGNRVMEYINHPGADEDFSPAYDLAGNLLFQHSMDAGDRWMLPDSTGKPLYAWDENDRVTDGGDRVLEQRLFHTTYDPLRRPLEQHLSIDGGPRLMIERFIYGENQPEDNAHNLRGQVYQHYDASGLATNPDYDFKGNLLAAVRQLASEYTEAVIDWTEGSPTFGLAPEIFTQNTEYDALNRMTRHYNWHRGPDSRVAVYEPVYNARGLLESEDLIVGARKTDTGYAGGTRTQGAIHGMTYDAKGQRQRIRYANGTITRYFYDKKTFRVLQIRTTRPDYEPPFPAYWSDLKDDKVLQQLYYTYDPVGNITEIHDDAYEPVFFQNQKVAPRSQYEYDALYRLISANGRENYHAAGAPGQFEPPPVSTDFPVTDQALRNYRQYYTYDPVGNIEQMRHVANGGSWTRTYRYATDSNRLLRTWESGDEVNAVRYQYDLHGSMLNFANVPDALFTRWDYRDMIQSIDLGGGGMAYYQYDAGKQRSRKVIERLDGTREERWYLGGLEWYRRFQGDEVVEEIETLHLFDGDRRVLLVEDVRVTGDDLPVQTLFRYQYSNHLGSVGFELDGSGEIISYEEYHPYGTTAYHAKSAGIRAAAKRYRYTGMERDEESGLAYHTARYYLAWLGRWGSCDPVFESSLNLYSYVEGQPVVMIDTNGRDGRISWSVLGDATLEVGRRALRRAAGFLPIILAVPLGAPAQVAVYAYTMAPEMARAYAEEGGGFTGALMAADRLNPYANAIRGVTEPITRGRQAARQGDWPRVAGEGYDAAMGAGDAGLLLASTFAPVFEGGRVPPAGTRITGRVAPRTARAPAPEAVPPPIPETTPRGAGAPHRRWRVGDPVDIADLVQQGRPLTALETRAMETRVLVERQTGLATEGGTAAHHVLRARGRGQRGVDFERPGVQIEVKTHRGYMFQEQIDDASRQSFDYSRDYARRNNGLFAIRIVKHLYEFNSKFIKFTTH